MCQRRWESPLSRLSDDCVFYILNMCRWDWMNDNFEGVRGHKKRLRTLSESVATADNNDGEDINDEAEGDDGDFVEKEEGSSSEEDGEANDGDFVEKDKGSFSEEDGEASEVQEEGRLPDEVEIVAAEGSSYDSDHAESDSESDAEGSDGSDDGFDDHRGGSTFQYSYYDDIGSSDEEREAEAFRERTERRRVMWLRAHFGQQLVRIQDAEDEDDDNEEESD